MPLPNPRLQPTWPRLRVRTLECDFEIPAKETDVKRKLPSAPGLARRSQGGAEPPAVGLATKRNI